MIDGRQHYAHRMAYELANGPIPNGMVVDHRTTCPKHCVNPDHLAAVTHKQNIENRAGVNRNSKSGVRGVYWQAGKWVAEVRHRDVRHYLGRFPTLDQAPEAAVAKRKELFSNNTEDYK